MFRKYFEVEGPGVVDDLELGNFISCTVQFLSGIVLYYCSEKQAAFNVIKFPL